MNVRTSAPPHELQLTMIAPHLGLTMAPGRQGRSSLGHFLWRRDLAADLDRSRSVHGVELLVSLIETHELRALGIPELVREIIRHSREERAVAIHCAAGIGRSGRIGGCTLVALARTVDESFGALRQRSARCPENDDQKELIRAFAHHLATRSS